MNNPFFTLKKWRQGLGTLLLALGLSAAHAQTVLVNPATDGGFENGTGSLFDNGWNTISSPATNDNWYTGTGLTTTVSGFSFPTSTRGAYIGSASGTWAYNAAASTGAVHMYKTVTVPAGQTEVILSFQYTQQGTGNTKLMVFVCDDSNTPVPAEPQSNGGTINNNAWGTGNNVLMFSAPTPLTGGTKTFTAAIPPSFLNNCSSSKTFKLVFTSFRNSTSGINPPPAVDSIKVISKTPISATPAVFTIDKTVATGGTNFASFTEAINWVNAVANCGLTNPITFNVSAGQTFDENTPYIMASGTATNQIIFQRSGSGANPVIRPTGEYGAYMPTQSNPGTADYGICLHGADYVTFDGIDINSNNFLGTATVASISVEFGYLIRNGSRTNGANNNTIKNATILLDRSTSSFGGTTPLTKAIVQTSNTLGGGYTALNANGTNNNNSYYNLTIGNVNQGIVLNGTSATLPDLNTKIGTLTPGTFNIIGRPGVANDIGNTATAVVGINLQFQYNATVSNNQIQNLTTTGAFTVDGIAIGSLSASPGGGSGGFNNEVSNNYISNLKSTSTSSTATISGMRIQHETAGTLGAMGFKIYNNVVTNLSSGYTGAPSATRVIRGIWLSAGAPSIVTAVQYEIVNNTIIVDGNSALNLSNIVLENNHAGSVFKLRNNLFYNITGAQSGVATHYILGFTTAATQFGATGSLSNYNDFYNSNLTGGYISPNNGNIATLTGWQAFYSVDANSLSADPKLNSPSIPYPLLSSPLIASGPTLSAPYNRDIMGNLRASGNSTIGAYEQTGDFVAPAIGDTLILGAYSTTNRSLPGLLNIIDDGGAVATAPGTAPRIYFKKSTEANALGGANNSTFNGWKWVEASNTTSPFDFTIDYSLLTSAVNIHDVIQYFYVAQDIQTTPNLSSLPVAGFVGTSVGTVTSAPTTPRSYIIYNAPTTYLTSDNIQADISAAEQNTTNNAILRVAVQTGPTGDSAYVTSLIFNSSMPNDFTNIAAARVWYTGTDSTYSSGATSSYKQFGNTFIPTVSGPMGTLPFAGGQITPANDTVYFWLTYDIKATATIGDFVDADVVSLTFDGGLQVPTNLAPTGSRIIKQSYCIPAPTSGNRHLSNVAFNTLNNNAGAAQFTAPFIVKYAPVGTATTTVKRGQTYNLTLVQATASTSVTAYFDFNDNGTFEPNETVIVSTTAGVAGGTISVPVTIPCDASISTGIRMRLTPYFTGNPWPNACALNINGEVQDYTISIIDNPSAYVSSSVTQFGGTIAPSVTDKLVMRLPIVTKGCDIGYLTEVRCNTDRTMNASVNIASAKLYSTGKTNAFSATELLSAVSTPSGSFMFSGFSDSLYSNMGDTNYYWITYDLSPTATLGDTIDLRVDSIVAINQYRIPSNNNPTPYLLVDDINTYISSDVIHPATSRTARTAQLYTPVLRIQVITSDTGAPLQMTSFNFDPAGGGNDSLNISKARVFYTGNSTTFSTANQFGNAYTAGTNMTGNKWNAFSISGNQDLNFATNYFWLAYDIPGNAAIGDSLDADLTSFTIGSNLQVPTTKTVTGAAQIIKPNYCYMGPSGGGPISSSSVPADWYEDITSVQLGTINNTSNCSQTGGPGSILNQYSDYSDIVAPANVSIGDAVAFTVSGVSNCNATYTTQPNMSFAILIDWNQNGIFDASEVAYRSAASTTVRTYTSTLMVPCNAVLGNTRMRVIYGTGNSAANAILVGSACGNTSTTVYLAGETEDYTINVVANPTYTINTSFVQSTGIAATGGNNVPILRVAVKPKGCGAQLNELSVTLAGTAPLADIANVKVYATGTSNAFATTNLLATAAPATNMIFTGLTGALTSNTFTDSNYFWVAFDVAASATPANLLDASVDSVKVAGVWYNTMTAGNPAGSRNIVPKMTFTDAIVTQPDTVYVARGAVNKQMLRINVTGSASSGPIQISSLSFNVNGGGLSNLNIDSARVFYTGTSATFATTTQFGSSYSAAPGSWGSFTINGDVSTNNTNNYFWLVYDIKSTATVLDSVDAEFTSVTFDGTPQVPTGSGAPSGNAKIRDIYCQTTHAGTNSQYYYFNSVTIGGITTASTTRVIPFYIDNTGTALRTVTMGTSNPISVTINDLVTPTASGGYTYLYIDLDQNGDFSGPNELITSVATPYLPSNPSATTAFSFFIPCGSKAGVTRLRLTTSLSSTAPALCGASPIHGETEDYLIYITPNPLTFNMSTSTQTSGTAILGGNNQVIMNVKVRTTGCGTPLLTNMYFNTTGSTNPATDIVAAKLYSTGKSNIFNTSKLLGTVAGPNGPFNFSAATISDTLAPNNDTTYYWLTYDVSPTATDLDTIDVVLDSSNVMGVHRIPTLKNPTPYKVIQAPMTVLNVSASYPSSDRVAQSTNNYRALRVRVIASSTGAALPVSSLNFNTVGGGNDVTNLASAKVYYTGSDSTFNTTKQFGATYTAGSNTAGMDWLPYAVSGYQELLPDTNYFWLTYNINGGATIGDSVDAEIPSIVIDGSTLAVTNSAPAGNAIISQQYCVPTGSSTSCIDTVSIGTLYNVSVGSCAVYTNYPPTGTKTTSVYSGASLPISLSFASPTRSSVFIDMNRNGIFEASEEFVLNSNYASSISTSIVIPTTTLVGETRMRLRTFGGPTQGGTDRSCSSWNQAEAEDYTITILPALPVTTYTWNDSGTTDFTTPSNWVPARNAASPSDILVFDADTTLNITNVFTQTVASIEVAQGTKVNLNASGNSVLKVTGTLILNDSTSIVGNSNITLEIGESTGNPGSITVGSVSGINAKMKRWVNAANSSSILFPFVDAKGSRNLNIAYTFAPLNYGSIVASFVPTKASGTFGFPLYEAAIGSDITKTCIEGYWNVEAQNGLSGGVYYGTFVMDSVKALPLTSNVTVINRTDDFNPWVLNGTHDGTSSADATTTVFRSNMQNFGQFAFAADSLQNPLPVTMLSFTAKADKDNAMVQWTTSSEVNNRGFDLERSIDGRTFEKVTFVKGNGTTMVAHQYAYNDMSAFAKAGSNVVYYRLKQVDMNGNFTYSEIVRVSKASSSLSAVSVSPNPFADNYSLNIESTNNQSVTVITTDFQGRLVDTQQISIVKGSNNISFNNLSQLRSGIYFIKVISTDGAQVIKVVKQ